MEKDNKEKIIDEYKDKQFEKIPDMKTSELLDWELDSQFKGHDVLYTDIYFDRDKGVYEELITRWPFYDFQEQINDLQNKIKGMQYAIDKLKVHKHDEHTGEALTTL